MKESNRKPGSVRKGGRAPEPPRKSIVFPVVIVAIIITGMVVGFHMAKKPAETTSTQTAPTSAPSPNIVVPPEPAPPIRPVAPVAENPAPAPLPPAPKPPPSVPLISNDPETARQSMAALGQLDGKNAITADQAKAWKDALQTLVRQGAAAIPLIQTFMTQNLDTNYGEGSAQLGYPSLRAGLIDALAQIGGSDATAAMLQILQSSTYPSDVAELAKGLGQAATGQYQQEFLSAVRQQLFLASQQPGANIPDVGPLFQVLATEGQNGAQVAQDVQQYGGAWSFYSAITLENLPDGAGLPNLMQMAQTAGPGQSVALDALAQMAPNNPQALTALLNLAKGGQISDFTLQSVAPFLGGQQFQLASNPDSIPPGAQVQTIHMSGGNQNFISVQSVLPGQINQQIDLINQLIQNLPASATDTLQALQQQRNNLTAKLAK